MTQEQWVVLCFEQREMETI